MAEAWVIWISIAFLMFILITFLVCVERKRKAKQKVGTVLAAPPPAQQQPIQQQEEEPPTQQQEEQPPAYEQVMYKPGQQFQPSYGYPNAPGQPYPDYPTQAGYSAQTSYPTQSLAI